MKEQKCEHCEIYDNTYLDSTLGDYIVEIENKKLVITLFQPFAREIIVDINYCPMCGRKLVDKLIKVDR